MADLDGSPSGAVTGKTQHKPPADTPGSAYAAPWGVTLPVNGSDQPQSQLPLWRMRLWTAWEALAPANWSPTKQPNINEGQAQAHPLSLTEIDPSRLTKTDPPDGRRGQCFFSK